MSFSLEEILTADIEEELEEIKDACASYPEEILTKGDLASWGVHDTAYVKLEKNVAGKQVWSIHAAEGTKLADTYNRDVAMVMVKGHEMNPASVH